jgi:hypothetical protein
MPNVYFDPTMTDDDRRSALYRGDIIILSPNDATRSLVALARSMLEEAFAPHDPRYVHKALLAEETADVLAKMKPQFIHHPRCKSIISDIMRSFGVDEEKNYFDVPRLRSAYPSHYLLLR